MGAFSSRYHCFVFDLSRAFTAQTSQLRMLGIGTDVSLGYVRAEMHARVRHCRQKGSVVTAGCNQDCCRFRVPHTPAPSASVEYMSGQAGVCACWRNYTQQLLLV